MLFLCRLPTFTTDVLTFGSQMGDVSSAFKAARPGPKVDEFCPFLEKTKIVFSTITTIICSLLYILNKKLTFDLQKLISTKSFDIVFSCRSSVFDLSFIFSFLNCRLCSCKFSVSVSVFENRSVLIGYQFQLRFRFHSLRILILVYFN